MDGCPSTWTRVVVERHAICNFLTLIVWNVCMSTTWSYCTTRESLKTVTYTPIYKAKLVCQSVCLWLAYL